MTLESYRESVVMLAKIYLKRVNITKVCTDTVEADFNEGVDLDTAALHAADESILWEGAYA